MVVLNRLYVWRTHDRFPLCIWPLGCILMFSHEISSHLLPVLLKWIRWRQWMDTRYINLFKQQRSYQIWLCSGMYCCGWRICGLLAPWFSTVHLKVMKFTTWWQATQIHYPLPSGPSAITRPQAFTCRRETCHTLRSSLSLSCLTVKLLIVNINSFTVKQNLLYRVQWCLRFTVSPYVAITTSSSAEKKCARTV